MRLSMWNIAECLQPFNPRVVTIDSGKRILRNARLLADVHTHSRTTLYVDCDSSGNVLCMNDHDIIVLSTDDIDLVLNTVLDTFDHYNEWDSQLHDAIQKNCDLAELLEIGAKEIGGFCVIADATFYIRESAGDKSVIAHNKKSLMSFENRSMPLDIIMRINTMEGVRSRNNKTYTIHIPELQTTPAISNLFVDNEHEGWLIVISSSHNHTQAQFDIQDAFAQKIEEALRLKRNISNNMSRTSIFTDILSGEATDESLIYQRLASLNWNRDDSKVIYAIRQIERQKNPQHVIERFLNSIDISSACVKHDGDLLFFVNATHVNLKTIEESMKPTLTMCGCSAGRSEIFKNIFEIPQQCDAAKVASKPSLQSGLIVSFQQVKLSYAISLIQKHAAADIKHDALDTLKHYDNTHDTNLLNTLFAYLKYALNATATAQALFIHRSTLLYRLERIEELTKIDLDDPDERLLLELSFKLLLLAEPLS